MEAYKDSKSYLIADVDCTTPEGKPLCTKNGVRGCKFHGLLVKCSCFS